jgi:hypothetical protein
MYYLEYRLFSLILYYISCCYARKKKRKMRTMFYKDWNTLSHTKRHIQIPSNIIFYLFVYIYKKGVIVVMVMVIIIMLNTTFNNISVISWRLVILMEETREIYRLVASHWQTLSHTNISTCRKSLTNFITYKYIDLSQVTDKLYHIQKCNVLSSTPRNNGVSNSQH